MSFIKYFVSSLFRKRIVTTTELIIYTSVFFVFFDNFTFFQHVLEVFPFSIKNIGFLLSLSVGLTAFIVFLLTLVSWKYTTKPVLMFFLLLSSGAAYFMDNYNVVIDHIMIQNILETNLAETSDLFSFKLLYYIFLLGTIPVIFIFRVEIKYVSWKKTAVRKIRDTFLSLLVLFGLILLFSQFYTSFFREYKPLRYYTNPTYYIYSVGNYINMIFSSSEIIRIPIGKDAKVVQNEDDDHPGLVILVVGEAVRADHFSLNGYQKETNPLLTKENIINFSNMYSCGTSTAFSVPCMFSILDRADYSYKKGKQTENILDVLMHTKQIEILWRDNNSDSKGVALRVPYEDYKTSKNNTICTDGECRDEGMLVGLDKYIAQKKGKDILIILHQMGNHGPAYYKRYPKKFEKFKPVCQTNQIEKCSKEEINNAYDNALLYTDYFLVKVINFLKKYDGSHETALIYISDHGESLGESGVYLHGLPYFIAPDAQTHIGALMWFGDAIRKDINIEKIKQNRDKKYSQDNLFHLLLGIFKVETEVYDDTMDILHQ
jgi:lipid A ethanolaminephosphotransferase